MTKTLQGYKKRVRIGRQVDRLTMCSFAPGDYEDDSAAEGWFDLAVSVDGVQGSGDNPSVAVPTQHGVRGTAYFLDGDRNQQAGQISLPLFPESAGFVLGLTKLVNDQHEYYTMEEYHEAGLGSETGVQLGGCIFTSNAINFNREAQGAVTINLSFFLNQDNALTAAPPAFTRPARPPYSSRGIMVDFVRTTEALGNNIPDIQAVDFNANENTTVHDHRGDPINAALDGAWTSHQPGQLPSLGAGITFRAAKDEYMGYHRESPKPDFQMRVGLIHTEPTYKATETISLTKDGGVQTISVSDVSGLANGDKVLITDATKFTVGTVSNIQTGPDSFDIDDADCTFAAESVQITNAAVEIRTPRMELSQNGRVNASQSISTIQHQFSAELEAGENGLYSYKAYDDDNA